MLTDTSLYSKVVSGGESMNKKAVSYFQKVTGFTGIVYGAMYLVSDVKILEDMSFVLLFTCIALKVMVVCEYTVKEAYNYLFLKIYSNKAHKESKVCYNGESLQQEEIV